MRKRIILSILLCLAVMGIVGCSSAWYHRDQDVVDYCSKINALIKDQDFRFAELADGKVILQDENRATLSEVAFDEYDSSIRFLSIWQEAPVIYFVVQGAVDDERSQLAKQQSFRWRKAEAWNYASPFEKSRRNDL